MSAEVLRKAAALMRERAEGAFQGQWERYPIEDGPIGDIHEWAVYSPDAGHDFALTESEDSAVHIASWHPAVALAVADWLDYMSKAHEDGSLRGSHALVVARAYLGESA